MGGKKLSISGKHLTRRRKKSAFGGNVVFIGNYIFQVLRGDIFIHSPGPCALEGVGPPPER
jgi:hypothetical protein